MTPAQVCARAAALIRQAQPFRSQQAQRHVSWVHLSTAIEHASAGDGALYGQVIDLIESQMIAAGSRVEEVLAVLDAASKETT